MKRGGPTGRSPGPPSGASSPHSWQAVPRPGPEPSTTGQSSSTGGVSAVLANPLSRDAEASSTRSVPADVAAIAAARPDRVPVDVGIDGESAVAVQGCCDCRRRPDRVPVDVGIDGESAVACSKVVAIAAARADRTPVTSGLPPLEIAGRPNSASATAIAATGNGPATAAAVADPRAQGRRRTACGTTFAIGGGLFARSGCCWPEPRPPATRILIRRAERSSLRSGHRRAGEADRGAENR